MQWYRDTGGFQCSAAGTGSETKTPAPGGWAAVWVTCYAADNSGSWETGEVSHPYLQNNARAIMGPVILSPGQQIATSVSGATPDIQTTIEYRWWLSSETDGSDLVQVVGTEITAGSVTTGTEFSLIASTTLTAGQTTTIQIGTGSPNAYSLNALSWQMIITGLGGSAFGCRVVFTKYDGAGNSLGYVQRDSSAVGTLDKIVASGILDAPAMTFQITLPAGAPAGCDAKIYNTAEVIQDNWLDTGIYENTSTMAGFFSSGPDGILVTVSNTVPESSSQAYAAPTYRGPVQVGITMTQAGHLAIGEATYLGGAISDNTGIPVSSSGPGEQLVIAFLGAFSNTINVFNDDAAATNVFFMEVRAIKDLLD